MSEVWLIRHGETEWSATGRHTGRTDVPLTADGRRQAEQLRRRLDGHEFPIVRTSPLLRARDTCAIVGFGSRAVVDADLSEWDYGSYEGRTTAEIRAENPGWTIWGNGVPQGETAAEVGARADRAIARVLDAPGDVAFFAHGHLLRVLAVRWLGLEVSSGGWFALDTASVSVLGRENGRRVIRRWNDVSHLG